MKSHKSRKRAIDIALAVPKANDEAAYVPSLEQALVEREWESVQDDADAKTEIVEEIYRRAGLWS